jgi:lysophospholipase L1-like esterase
MQRRRQSLSAVFSLYMILLAGSAVAEDLLRNARRIVFLGDSITYSGEYVGMFEAALRLSWAERPIECLDLGLPSETVSGLSEPGHASGEFPRPDLHERLDRLLAKTQPDLVIACYGMNCGIYHPYSDERFDAYRQGIRKLRRIVAASQARLVLVTPPVFDPEPILEHTLPFGSAEYRLPFRNYNQVLDLFAAWLVAAHTEGWEAIDIHYPMSRFLEKRRSAEDDFTLASDGVHLNREGHWLIARELIRRLNAPLVNPDAETVEAGFSAVGPILPLLGTIKQRQTILTDAWLSHIGHKRPGMNAGLPLNEAIEKARVLDLEIQTLAKSIAPEPGAKAN